ncbi:MAG: transcriptional repressor [Veillonella sp.]|uniref:Fur family transcriptional regulator n=1 Tax=Veillonella sp. TaxID=1926307 RepID=UPI002601234C|nr:transcriptional repressor [Veillonella sp.]MBS4914341.1 transcriptional repressor [Veillonella sp.]
MDIAQKLRSEGFKVTPQRIAIYQVLYGQNEHPTAEMIYQSLRNEHPTMSLATVYKTMEIFEKIGLVKVLDIGDECSRYDWDTHNHPHLRCTVCNRVDDLDGMEMEDMFHEVEMLSQYKVTGQQITFEGVCPDCQRKDAH